MSDLTAAAHILGTGFYVPPRVVTNHDLAEMFETSDEWIQQRTGIKERRYADENDPPAVMAEKAARAAIENAGLEVGDIDGIILGTLSPDYNFPGSSVIVQRRLGLAGIAAMDVRNQCTGLLYSLATADAWIRMGLAKNILVIGTEVHSTGIKFAEDGRDVTVLFGDGASALVVGPTPDPSKGLMCHKLHADGNGMESLWMPYPSSAHFPHRAPQSMYTDPVNSVYPQMEGRKVFKFACKKLPEVILEVCAATGKTLDDIDVLVPHQANMRINEMVAKMLKFPPEKVVHNIQKYGNTTAASVGIALHEAREDGRVTEGSTVMLAAFGSGFTWAASLVQF
jgi:3-oxoacyl-[acyl-carrier-protein] synthase-3